jgi:hypothetical protein
MTIRVVNFAVSLTAKLVLIKFVLEISPPVAVRDSAVGYISLEWQLISFGGSRGSSGG